MSEFFTPWHHPDPVISFVGIESLAHPEFADEADINNIIKRYQATGQLVDPLRINHNRRPIYGDFSDVKDLQQAFAIAAQAEELYNRLPLELRKRFASPLDLESYIVNPDNREECVRLGLIIAKAVSTATPEPATPKAIEKPAIDNDPPKDDD